MIKPIPKNYLFSKTDLRKLTLPIVAELFLNIFVGLVDTIMVANAGEAAVSGVTLVNSIVTIVINLLSALAMGGAVVVGHALGRNREDEACKAANQTFIATIAVSLLLMIIMYVFKNIIMYGLFGDAEADVMHCADVYLLIVNVSFPFLGLYNAGATIFRTSDDSRTPMAISVIMNIINIVGNAILVYGFKMGVAGVAIPTLVSRIVAAVLIMAKISNKNLKVHIKREFKIDFPVIKQIMGIGIPNSVENSLAQLGNVIVTTVVVCFGTSAIAGHTVTGSIGSFMNVPGLAICQVILTVISRCYGAGDMEQLKFYVKRLTKLMYECTIAFSVVILMIMPLIFKMYNLSEEAMSIAEPTVILYAVAVCLFFPLAFGFPNAARAVGDSVFTMVASIVSMWCFKIPLSYVFGKWLGWGVFGVWLAGSIEYAIKAVVFPIRYKIVMKR